MITGTFTSGRKQQKSVPKAYFTPNNTAAVWANPMAKFPGSVLSLRLWSSTEKIVKTIWKLHRTSIPSACPAFISRGTWVESPPDTSHRMSRLFKLGIWRLNISKTDPVDQVFRRGFHGQGQVEGPGRQSGPQALHSDVEEGPEDVHPPSGQQRQGHCRVHLITDTQTSVRSHPQRWKVTKYINLVTVQKLHFWVTLLEYLSIQFPAVPLWNMFDFLLHYFYLTTAVCYYRSMRLVTTDVIYLVLYCLYNTLL